MLVPRLAAAGALAALTALVTVPGASSSAHDHFAVAHVRGKAVAPANTGAPGVTGTPKEGQVLASGQGSWSGTTPQTYAYQWQRCATTSPLANGTFDTDTAGWAAENGAAIARVTTPAHSGAGSLKIATPGGSAPSQGAIYRFGAGSIQPGHTYRFRVYVDTTATTTVWTTVRFYDASGAEVPDGGYPYSVAPGWSLLGIRLTAPAGATSGSLGITVDKTAATFYADDATLADCTAIAGATSPSYTVQAADAGSTLASLVTASNSAGTAAAMSEVSAMALDRFDTAPAYSGPVYGDDAAAAAADPVAPPPVTTTLPTWRNLYDWQNGSGYAGWHYATSAADGRYGADTNHGGNPGLWLWPTGGQRYTPGYAEWTYTAPGTTRLSTVHLTFSYRNKFLAHHCIAIGLRTLDGTTVSEDRWCQPALPPDSQRDVDVHLADPANDPVAKVLYFRVELPSCDCSKYIPQLDPLTVGAFARLELADMILVDDDQPELQPSGPLWDIRGTYIDGTATYGVTVSATDAGSGITKAWLERIGYSTPMGVLATQDAPCDATHHTDALDARVCPSAFAYQTTVDSTQLSEGTSTFDENAQDVAGNDGVAASWQFYVDRTPPSVPANLVLSSFDASAGEALVGWDASSDPPLPDGTAGSGFAKYQARYQLNGGNWTDWQDTAEAALSVSPAAPGDVLNVEVRSVDAVGNTSAAAAASFTLEDTGIPDITNFADPPAVDLVQPFTLPTLTPDQAAQATAIADADPKLQEIVGGRGHTTSEPTAWANDDGTLAGASLTVQFDQPQEIGAAWPLLSDDGSSVQEQTNSYLLDGVTSIDVTVDLSTGAVVSIDPNPDATYAPETVSNDRVARNSTRASATAATSPTYVDDEEDKGLGRPTAMLRPVCFDGDCFFNYDFSTKAKDENTVAWNLVDWPVSMIWTGNAEVDKVKSVLVEGVGLTSIGGAMAASLAQERTHNWTWDTDHGAKGDPCTFYFKTPHTRVYADPDTDQLFNPDLGFYVLGTTHFDAGECIGVPLGWVDKALGKHWSYGWSGYSETAEKLIDHSLEHDPFFSGAVREDVFPMFNAEHHAVGRHKEDNNGRASLVEVP